MVKMRTKAGFSERDMAARARAVLERAKARAVGALAPLADAMRAHMQAEAEFNNHTHDLRSSLAATVFRDGREERAGSRLSEGSGGTAGGGLRGIGEGKRVARAETPARGMGVMLTAGMGYAARVESLGHRSVISQTARELERRLEKMTA